MSDPFAEARAEQGLIQPMPEMQPAEPTRRRPLTPEECAKYDLPYGTEAPTDAEGRLRQVPADARDYNELNQAQACNPIYGGPSYPVGVYGSAYPTPEASMRMSCLQMALAYQDGAPPPPLDEVLKRAQAYWRFIQTGG